MSRVVERVIAGHVIALGGSIDLSERAQMVSEGICPDCGDCPEDVRECPSCGGTGRAVKCIQCGAFVDPTASVDAVEIYCPQCAATEIDKLWKDNEQLMAEVERLRVLLKETCQFGVKLLTEGVGHA